MPTIAGIHHTSVTVTDIDRSVPWYVEVLGLTNLTDEHHPVLVFRDPDNIQLEFFATR